MALLLLLNLIMTSIFMATLSFALAVSPTKGSVTGVSVAPATVETGQEVAITVEGTNPCGAVHLITGDGAAVTHPITGLPSTHAHTYRKPGKYSIVAQGMGNCDGEATTTIDVTGKPLDPDSPPAPRAELRGLEIEPHPGRPGEPVTFTLAGEGTCEVVLEFGDDSTRTVRGALPQRGSHTYADAGRYTITATATAPCEGRHSQELEVVKAPPYEMDPGTGRSAPHDTELPHALTRYDRISAVTAARAPYLPAWLT